MGLWQELRADYVLHGRVLRNRVLWALAVYRFGRWAMQRRSGWARWLGGKVYGLLFVFSEMLTGISLQRDTEAGVGPHFIPAGGIYIPPPARLGDHVGIMHNVTIGTNMGPEVPVIGNHVFIGCGASILGDVHVGDGSRIAANSLVINDVPPGSFVVGVPAKSFKRLAGAAPRAGAKATPGDGGAGGAEASSTAAPAGRDATTPSGP